MRTFTHDGGFDDTIAGWSGWLVWLAEEVEGTGARTIRVHCGLGENQGR